LCFLSNSLLGF